MKLINDFRVIANERLNADFSVLTLQLKLYFKLPSIKPGQFAEVRIDNTSGVILRRPISIHDVDYEENRLKLLVQNVGKGTNYLCNLPVDTSLNLIYPLGNGFPLPQKNQKPLLIGGGCGVAPLLYLGRYFKENGIKPRFLIGARNAKSLILKDEYSRVGELLITTDDGSEGCMGNVLNHPIFKSQLPDFNIVYTCGPEVMLKALANYCQQQKITCYVSLENRMACGIGACLCCVTETIEGNKCTCVDGPVFNTKYLKW